MTPWLALYRFTADHQADPRKIPRKMSGVETSRKSKNGTFATRQWTIVKIKLAKGRNRQAIPQRIDWRKVAMINQMLATKAASRPGVTSAMPNPLSFIFSGGACAMDESTGAVGEGVDLL